MSWAARREKLRMQFLLRAKEPCRQSTLCERLKLCIHPQCTVRQLVLKFENDRYSRIESSPPENKTIILFTAGTIIPSRPVEQIARRSTLISAGIIYAVCMQRRESRQACRKQSAKTHTFTRHRESRLPALCPRSPEKREQSTHNNRERERPALFLPPVCREESSRHYSPACREEKTGIIYAVCREERAGSIYAVYDAGIMIYYFSSSNDVTPPR